MDLLQAQVEVWKKVVDVQQHFNDLELRIRNFALVVTGAFLGLGGYAIKDGDAASFAGYSASSLIVAASLLPLIAFYLMDRFWYHRLLDGSVKAGISAEANLIALGVEVELGSQISKASPFKLLGIGPKVHSRHKMDGFYGLLAAAIIALAITLSHQGKAAERSALKTDATSTRAVEIMSGSPETPLPVVGEAGAPAAELPAAGGSNN